MAIRVDDVDLDRDRVLVRRFQAGDHTAFDELYRCYHDRLERFCLKRVGDQHAAEEVAQEAFTRALIALPAFDGDRRFYPWVSVIASRLCIDHHRRQARSQPIAHPDTAPTIGGQDDIVDAVDDILAVAALARLAPRHQAVLRLREVEGWTYQRIADHYGVRVGTVETLLFRARRALRREFRVVDGAGLAAIPVIARLIGAVARGRDRIGPYLTLGGATSTVVVAAAAAAAAIATTPGSQPVIPPAPPPAAAVSPARPPGDAVSGLRWTVPPTAVAGAVQSPMGMLTGFQVPTNSTASQKPPAGTGPGVAAVTGPTPPAPVAGVVTTISRTATRLSLVRLPNSLDVSGPVAALPPALRLPVPALPVNAQARALTGIVGGLLGHGA